MTVTVSPLELLLDEQNPRFVILDERNQESIRRYLCTYEDTLGLANEIHAFGGLLPGERIVALEEDGHFVVIEGNRRTCCLQMLLAPGLIPHGFEHRLPEVSSAFIENCTTVEVDIINDRDTALALMAKRHIEGVKQWKPLAKKQFFVANYANGTGRSVKNLSTVTGIRPSEIKDDIKEYKFFIDTYAKYQAKHPDFDTEIISLKIDPFWRIFKTKFDAPGDTKASPKEFLQLSIDDNFVTGSALPNDLFEEIILLVFEQAIVAERITTRHTLSDVPGICPLLQAVAVFNSQSATDSTPLPTPIESSSPAIAPPTNLPFFTNPIQSSSPASSEEPDVPSQVARSTPLAGGPAPGGPAPRSFFETISWHDKLDPAEPAHSGLLCSIHELFELSTRNIGKQKAYQVFPVATGMVLRTVYEQALILRLKQANLWRDYMKGRNADSYPTANSIERFIEKNGNSSTMFPDRTTKDAFSQVVSNKDRQFLNGNVHSPGTIAATPGALDALASRGMFTLIQDIINLL